MRRELGKMKGRECLPFRSGQMDISYNRSASAYQLPTETLGRTSHKIVVFCYVGIIVKLIIIKLPKKMYISNFNVGRLLIKYFRSAVVLTGMSNHYYYMLA